MIRLDIVSPLGVPPICLGLFLILVIPFFLSIYFFRKVKKNIELNRYLILFSIVYIIIGIVFFILQFSVINGYWYFYDYSIRLLIQTFVYLFLIILVPILINFGIKNYYKRSSKKFIRNVAILIILILIISPFTFSLIPINKKPHQYIYTLKIETNPDNSFILLVPTFYYEDRLTTLMEKNDIIGHCEYENVQDNGTFLKIIGTGSISINYNYEGLKKFHWTGYYKNYNLSKDRDHRCEYVIYYESESNLSVNVILNWEYKGRGSEKYVNMDGDINKNGWQTLNGGVQHIAVA